MGLPGPWAEEEEARREAEEKAQREAREKARREAEQAQHEAEELAYTSITLPTSSQSKGPIHTPGLF